jgi:hypothetical protein
VSQLITCPSCRRTLRVADDLDERWLTCPRCLRTIGNPRYHDETIGAIQTAPSPAPAEHRLEPSDRPTCPGCGWPVEERWKVCPHCEEPLSGRRAEPSANPLDRDVRHDSAGVGIGLIVLGALGGIGVFLFLCGGGLQGMSARAIQDAGSVSMVIALVLCILVVIGGVLAMRGRETAGRILAVLLCVLTVAMLIVVVTVAGFVMMLASCLAPCEKKSQPPPRQSWRCPPVPGSRMLPAGGGAGPGPYQGSTHAG